MALLRHSGIYFGARIISGAASFVLIAVYTRLFDPQIFGELALALAATTFFSALVIDGLMLALLRYLPGDRNGARATMLWGLVLPLAGLCCGAAAALFVFAPERWHIQAALCATLLLAIIGHRFQLATAQAELRPERYALLGSLESLFDMVLGIGLVVLGYGVSGVLLGTTLAALIVLAVGWRSWWIGPSFFDWALGRQMLRFGTPLMLSTLFLWLATFGDRWLLALFAGAGQTGLYAAAYDLQMNLLGVPIIVMQLAGIPLAASALTERGAQAAQNELRRLGALIALILLPEAVGIVMTGPLLTSIFLGKEFRALSLSLLPILVTATFLKALMMYVSYGFILAARTNLTLWAMAGAAAIDLALNVALIPGYGPLGAAIAALAGFAVGFAIATASVRRVFPFPLPRPTLLTTAAVALAAMVLWLLPFRSAEGWSAVLYVIPIAVAIYFAAAFLFLHFTGHKPLEVMRTWWARAAAAA
jgi:O-antigen/teichoic acid export membrane protein